MKRIGYFLLAAFLLIILVGGVSCQSKTTAKYTTATPEGTVRLLLNAYENLDANKVAELFVKEDREEIRSLMSQRLSQYKSISLSEIEMETIAKTENTAKVKVQGQMTITVKEPGPQSPYPIRELATDPFDLVKQNGKWLIKAPPDL